MAVTVASQTARLVRMFPEITSAVASEYMNYANRELCFDMPIYTLEEDLTLDGSSATFTLNADDLRVWSATYYYSSTLSKPLRAVTKRGLEKKFTGWRNTPESIPGVYAVYKESDVLKLQAYPQPSVATSSGYPKITLRVSRHTDLSTNLPGSLVVPEVYALKAAHLYCIDHGLVDRAAIIEPALHMAIQKNIQGFDFMVVDAPPETRPGFRFPSVVRR